MSQWRSADDRPDNDRRVLVRVPSAVKGGRFRGAGIFFGRWDDVLDRWRIEGVPNAPEVDLWCEIPKTPTVKPKYLRSQKAMPLG